MALYCGIDLGTTNCTVSLINVPKKGQNPLPLLKTLPIYQYDKVFNIQTNRIEMPSYLYFELDDLNQKIVYTGDYAKQEYIKGDRPMNVVNAVKTRIGGESIVQIKSKNQVEMFTMTECSAIYLKNILLSIKKQLGEEVVQDLEEVIITIPAAFNHAERIATENAAKIAGFKKIILLAEPTAALYWYIHDATSQFAGKIKDSSQRNILVYDIGGGTLDVTLAKITKNSPAESDDFDLDLDDTSNTDIEIDILAKSQRMDLGGNNFDQRLAAYLLDQFETGNFLITEKTLTEQQQIISRLVGQAEEIKVELNSKILRFLNNPERLNRVCHSFHFLVSNDHYYSDELFKNHLDEIFKCFDVRPAEAEKFSLLYPIAQCLKEANLTVNDINDVILTGGMSNFYFVKNALREYFPETVSFETTDTAASVSKGAALFHYSLYDENFNILKPDLKEKMTDDIWIKKNNKFEKIISKNLEQKAGYFEYKITATHCDSIPIFLYYGNENDDHTSYIAIGGGIIRLNRVYQKDESIKIDWQISDNQEILITSKLGDLVISEKNQILTLDQAKNNKIHSLKINNNLF
jgi:molecular chaperone DnaK